MKIYLFLMFFIFINTFHGKEKIIVGSKNFTESFVLSEIVSTLLEAQGVEVVRKFGLGGTNVAFEALNAGEIDTYPEYTGTGLILIPGKTKNTQKIYDYVSKEFFKRWKIRWSEKIGFNNTYALAVDENNKKLSHVKKISDLRTISKDLRYAAPYEFMERKDGHDNLNRLYRLKFKKENIFSMNVGLLYSAIKNKRVDVIVGYSTDGQILENNLRILKDDRNFFPPYDVAFVYKEKTLNKKKRLEDVFNKLKNRISEEEMIEMNDQVDRFKRDIESVARNFLLKEGLLKGKLIQENGKENFFSFLKRKKSYVLKLFKEHIFISFVSLFSAFIVSLLLGVLLTRYSFLGRITFPIINVMQTIPSLAFLGVLIPVMGIGEKPAILVLFLYSLLPMVRGTYSGINGIDKKYLEVSKGIGLNSFQILMRVEFPLALPIIFAGLRTASVIVIGTATIAAFVGAGGFGDPIFRGISTANSNLILLGAIPSALLAVCVDKFISVLESLFVSKGLRLNN